MIYSQCGKCKFIKNNECQYNQFHIGNIAPGFCRYYINKEDVKVDYDQLFEFEIILVLDDLIKEDDMALKAAVYFSSYPECQRVHILDVRSIPYAQKRTTLLKLIDLKLRHKNKIFIHSILDIKENIQQNIGQITNIIKSKYTIICRSDQLIKDCSFERLIKEMNTINNRFIFWKFSNIIDQTIVFLKASIYGVYISNILKRIINSDDVIKAIEIIEDSTKMDLIKQIDYINVR